MLFEDTVDILTCDSSFHDASAPVSFFQLALNEALSRQSLFDKGCALRHSDSDLDDDFSLQTVTLQIEDDLFPAIIIDEDELNEEIAAVEEHIARITNHKRTSPSLSIGASSALREFDPSNDDIFSDDSFFSFGDDFSLLGLPSTTRCPKSLDENCRANSDEAPSKKRKVASSKYQSHINSLEVVIIEESAPMVQLSSSPAADTEPSSPSSMPPDASAANFDTTPLAKKRRSSPKQSLSSKKKPTISPRKDLKLEPTTNPAVKILLTEKPNLYQGEEVLRISKVQASDEDEEIDIGDDFDC